MRLEFKKFIEQDFKIYNSFSQNTVGKHNDYATAAFLTSNLPKDENPGAYPSYGLPINIDVKVPAVIKKSKIRSIDKNKNPIKIMLLDGTKLYLTIDEFNRINSKVRLEVGKEIEITFQRRFDDESPNTSKIIDIN